MLTPTLAYLHKPSSLQSFNFSSLQAFHPSTLQACNPSTLQLFNPSSLQPFNPSTFQAFKPSTLQPFKPALQPFNPSSLQPFNISSLRVLLSLNSVAPSIELKVRVTSSSFRCYFQGALCKSFMSCPRKCSAKAASRCPAQSGQESHIFIAATCFVCRPLHPRVFLRAAIEIVL